MMRKLIFIISCLCVITCSWAEQPPMEQWVAWYDSPNSGHDTASAMTLDVEGNIYVTGWSDQDYITIKYDSNGIQLWTARYNGPGNSLDIAKSIALDETGNVYITGESEAANGKYDYATIKYNSEGSEQWVARYNGPANDEDNACMIAVDDFENVYVTGTSYDPNTSKDYATVKYDQNGNELWVARYNGPQNLTDESRGLVVDQYNDIYVFGTSWFDYATVKYDPNGVELWERRYNYSENSHDYAAALTIDQFDNIYVTGSTEYAFTTTIKYNTDGDQLWVCSYSEPNCLSYPQSIKVNKWNNVYVAGRNPIEYLTTMKYDPNGIVHWTRQYTGPHFSYGGVQPQLLDLDSMGNIYMAGPTDYSDSNSSNYAIIKYDSDGNQCWAVEYNGVANGFDMPFAIIADDMGNVYVTGMSHNVPYKSDCATIKYTQHGYCTDFIEGDFDNSCRVDLVDFTMMGESWLDVYNLSDLATLAEYWLTCKFALEEDCW